MRRRPARVTIVDDDLECALVLAAALAVDERIEVDRHRSTLAVAELLGRILAWRADLVVLDLDGGAAGALVQPLRSCGVEVVVRTGHPDPTVPPGCVVVPTGASLGELVSVVRGRFVCLRGRPAPPRLPS